jgi:acyl carrier protein
MTREEVNVIVQNIFIDIFDRDDINITDDMTADSLEGWDSLYHVIIIGAIEKEFAVRFALGEIAELKNVGAIIDLILDKIR